MEPIIFANKYKVLDALYQGEVQNIYVAEDIKGFGSERFIINEILDSSIIYSIKEVFNEDAKAFLKNFQNYFYQDSNFYIVSSIPSGTTLDNYLSSESLRLSDKMYITESLLTQLLKLEKASRMFKYNLLNPENILVAANRRISFNLGMRFDKEGLYATEATIISMLGDVICCIFANTVNASLEEDKDSMPPAIASIVRKCKDDSYNSIELVYKDFKASLLYSTFIGNSSVDKQIMQNIHKARRKRSFKPLKRVAALILIMTLLAGGYFGLNKLLTRLPALSRGDSVTNQQNQIPIAKFTMSKSKVYVGDKINFVSQSTDPDIDDRIEAYEWSVSRNGDMYILFSREQNPSYTFEAEGDYVVSLIVKDSFGISSNAYKVGFTVYPREEIPDDGTEQEEEDAILK